MSKWRDHVQNRRGGHKVVPLTVSPGGRVDYRCGKLPQLPAPEFLAVDYPFIKIDNWEIRFYPMWKTSMDWLAESTVRWARENRCPEYRRYLNEFITTLETITKNPPVRTRRPWP